MAMNLILNNDNFGEDNINNEFNPDEIDQIINNEIEDNMGFNQNKFNSNSYV